MDDDIDPIELDAVIRASFPVNRSRIEEETTESPLDQLLRKGQFSNCELAYLWGLDSQNSVMNLVGYLMLLKNRDRPRFEALTEDVDRKTWAHVFEVLHFGESTASHLFMIQDEMRDFISRQPGDLGMFRGLLSRMDHTSLELLSGKWGFSKREIHPDLVQKLQDGIENLGRRMGRSKISPAQFVADIFRHFNSGMLAKTVKDPLLKKFRLFAFSYIANGYLRIFPHGERQRKLEALTKESRLFFSFRDLQGFALGGLIQDPKDILEKINKASKIMPMQHAVFESFSAPLRPFLSEKKLWSLRAFLNTFDLSFLDIEKEQRRLGFFQLALQDKTPDQISQMVTSLVDNGFLPEDISDIELTLIESAQYNESLPYGRHGTAIQRVAAIGKGKAEPSLGVQQNVLNQGLQLWLRAYFDEFYKLAYVPREAFVVEYEGPIQEEMVERDAEVTKEQAEIAADHMALYVVANEMKSYLFPEIPVGQKAVLSLTETRRIKVDRVNEDDGAVLETKVLDPSFYDEDVESFIEKVVRGVDPNILPAAVKVVQVPSDVPFRSQHAVRGGAGISEQQKIQSRGRAIDFLIRGGRIERTLKLPILLYLYGW